MSRRIPLLHVTLAFALAFGAAPVAHAQTVEQRSHRGDNTIYLEWDRARGRVITATSSRRFTAEARVQLLTSLREGDGRLVMRSRFRNVSDATTVRVRGRLVHRIWDEAGDPFRRFRSHVLDVTLGPGESIGRSFRYSLPSGRYTIRTDFRRVS